MSFLAGQVMSLLGRPQDMLSHVLVEPAALESPDSGFWWPGDGSTGSEHAQVQLHQVPFLRVRAWLEPEQLQARTGNGFAQAVTAANMALGDAPVEINLATHMLQVDDIRLPLNARELALLSFLAVARVRRLEISLVGTKISDHAVQHMRLGGSQDNAARLWAWLYGAASLADIHADSILAGFHSFDAFVAKQVRELESGRYGDLAGQPLSRLRRKLARVLPAAMARRIIAPGRGLATLLQPASIRIVVPTDLAEHPDRPSEAQPVFLD